MIYQRFALLCFVYLFIRLIIPWRAHWAIKVAATAILLPATQYHYIIRNYFGSLASPELPFLVLVFVNWLFMSMAFITPLILLRDCGLILLWVKKLLHKKFGDRDKIKPRSYTHFYKSRLYLLSPTTQKVTVVMLVVSLMLGGYGVYAAIKIPQIQHYTLNLKNLPPELNGFKLVHITDLHASALLPSWRVDKIVTRVNALNPDLILTTGDLIDGNTDRRKNDIAPIGKLKATYGVYGCDGNHEYYSGYSPWMEHFRLLGINMLHNEHVLIPPDNPGLVIAGVNDRAAVGASGALRGAPKNLPAIILEHRPGRAALNASTNAVLQLSGHTHGGQLVLFDRFFIAKHNNGFVRGWYQLGNMRLYVSPGAGLWPGFPVRVGVPSEITVFTLQNET